MTLAIEADQETALREILRQLEHEFDVDARRRPAEVFQLLLADLRATVWFDSTLSAPTGRAA